MRRWLCMGLIVLLGCEVEPSVRIHLARTETLYDLAPGASLTSTLKALAAEEAVPGAAPSEWPEDFTLQITADDPLVFRTSGLLIKLDDDARIGGSLYKKYRNNIRAIDIEGLAFRIASNTLSQDLGPLVMTAGESDHTSDELEFFADLRDEIQVDELTAEGTREELPMTDSQRRVLEGLLIQDRFKLGLEHKWTGVIAHDTELPTGAVTIEIFLTAWAEANPL